MEQTVHLGRGGWKQEEIDLLWKEIRAAAETGAPLRGVFDRMGETLGRKPNSVRNYYYMQLRDQAGEDVKRAAPFDPFSPEEIHDLLRSVLMARGRGQSVRACVTALSGGDKSRMLRYQNKYRAILRKKPALISQICEELKQEGLPCPDSPKPVSLPAPEASLPPQADEDVQAILRALSSLARRAAPQGAKESDRLKVQRDLLLIQVEDIQAAARGMIQECKDFLGCPPDERARLLPGFCDQLSHNVAKLESVSG